MSNYLFIMAVIYLLLNVMEFNDTKTVPSFFNALGWLGFALVIAAEVFK